MNCTQFVYPALTIFFATSAFSGQNPETKPEQLESAELQRQRDRLLLENSFHDEALRRELSVNTTEVLRLKSETELERAKIERELAKKRLEIEQARLEMEQITVRVSLESARRQSEMLAQLAELRAAKERADLEADVALAQFTKRNNDFRTAEVEWNARLVELRAKVAQRETESNADAYAEQRPVYLKEPLTPDGELVLSDRRITLNGPISMATADFINARIDYFNNKSPEYPIFLVIDESPGGSVMAGYKILKGMQSSTAPVYVVVKSFAASMAAALATLAERSFAYPNAIILHHQISAGSFGNLTMQREELKNLEQWWQRLALPIATKMGITPDEFVKQMYEHSASGDWKEFADNAARLKWVDTVIGRCRETAWVKNPDAATEPSQSPAKSARPLAEKVDEKGRTHALLPRLNPVDCYFLYNPDGYYRVE